MESPIRQLALMFLPVLGGLEVLFWCSVIFLLLIVMVVVP
jgi:hypothetical protein